MSERHLHAVDGGVDPAPDETADGTADETGDGTVDGTAEEVDVVLDAVDVVLDAAAGLAADDAESAGGDATDGAIASDPLLDRAARIADLPLDERPGAFDSLNATLVAELNQLEDL